MSKTFSPKKKPSFLLEVLHQQFFPGGNTHGQHHPLSERAAGRKGNGKWAVAKKKKGVSLRTVRVKGNYLGLRKSSFSTGLAYSELKGERSR